MLAEALTPGDISVLFNMSIASFTVFLIFLGAAMSFKTTLIISIAFFMFSSLISRLLTLGLELTVITFGNFSVRMDI